MTFSPTLCSTITNTKMRTPMNISAFSGMCTVCTADCIGSCEIGLSALRGSEAIYPYNLDKNQFASEKNYPLDFSHFNINGRVFGALGIESDSNIASFPNVDLNTSIGLNNKIKLKAPLLLPATAKLNWPDYFAGAAMSGTLAVIGEDVIAKDKEFVIENHSIVKSPLLEKMVNSFKKYYHGYGQIIVQANVDDESFGVLEYAINKLEITCVELKFGQGSKGIQGMGRVKSLEDALTFQQKGYFLYPDPSDPKIQENYKKGIGPIFEKIGKLPMWNEDILINRVKKLKEIGAKQVCFKVGPFDPKDLVRILKIASTAEVDMVTFDGAGGGSGNSPSKMMNEWGIPTVYLESILYEILKEMKSKNYSLPKIAIAGGFVMEDQVFKALSLGAPYISIVGIGRASMAAAMVGKQIGDLIAKGIIPAEVKRFGSSKEEIFGDIRELKEIYGSEAVNMPSGAIGLYSFINRVSAGLRQLMALNRKFSLEYIDRSDIVSLTPEIKKVSSIDDYMDLKNKALDTI